MNFSNDFKANPGLRLLTASTAGALFLASVSWGIGRWRQQGPVQTSGDNAAQYTQMMQQMDAEEAIAAPQQDASEATRADLWENGMESNAAALHLVRPFADPYLDPKYALSQSLNGMHWWGVQPRSTNTYSDASAPERVVFTSYHRALDNAYFAAQVVLDPSGTYSVQATLGARAVRALQNIVKPLSDDPTQDTYIDWLGVSHAIGAPDTVCVATLVSNNQAFEPFSVSQIASDNTAPVTVLLASGLSSVEANELVNRLQ